MALSARQPSHQWRLERTTVMADHDNSKIYVSYNQIHSSIRNAVDRFAINDDFQPDLMIAIGGQFSLHCL